MELFTQNTQLRPRTVLYSADVCGDAYEYIMPHPWAETDSKYSDCALFMDLTTKRPVIYRPHDMYGHFYLGPYDSLMLFEAEKIRLQNRLDYVEHTIREIEIISDF